MRFSMKKIVNKSFFAEPKSAVEVKKK